MNTSPSPHIEPHEETLTAVNEARTGNLFRYITVEELLTDLDTDD